MGEINSNGESLGKESSSLDRLAELSTDELRSELARRAEEEAEQARRERACRSCGARDYEFGGDSYLTDFKIAVAVQEEGHSEIEGWLCADHLSAFSLAVDQLGLSLHAHGGICYLEAFICPGYGDPANCPAPESQYSE